MTLNRYIDHTLLKSTATLDDIVQLCEEAATYNFYSVCVHSCYVSLAKKILEYSGVKVCAVVGFPLGNAATEVKVFEAQYAMAHGASEIDMVMNLGYFKSKEYDKVLADVQAVKKAIGEHTLKVILEISELTDAETVKACEICMQAKADFVKTSTGFSKSGATLEAIKIMKDTVGNTLKIKASGGIRTAAMAKRYIALGADRIGASSGVAMMQNQTSDECY